MAKKIGCGIVEAMDTLLGSFRVLLALVSTLLTPGYIATDISSVTLEQNPSDRRPLYQAISITNRGVDRAQFLVSGNLRWMFVGRETNSILTTVTMVPGTSTTFIAEIHPELIEKFPAEGIITITARNVLDDSVLDTANVRIVVIEPTQPSSETSSSPSPTTTTSRDASLSPSVSPSPMSASPATPARSRTTIQPYPSLFPTVSSLTTSASSPALESDMEFARKRFWLWRLFDFFWR